MTVDRFHRWHYTMKAEASTKEDLPSEPDTTPSRWWSRPMPVDWRRTTRLPKDVRRRTRPTDRMPATRGERRRWCSPVRRVTSTRSKSFWSRLIAFIDIVLHLLSHISSGQRFFMISETSSQLWYRNLLSCGGQNIVSIIVYHVGMLTYL